MIKSSIDIAEVHGMLMTNREYLRRKSNIALQNLAMLHKSFDNIDEEGCIIGLALNDSIALLKFTVDRTKAYTLSSDIIGKYPDSPYVALIAEHERILGRCCMDALKYDEAREHLIRGETLVSALDDTSDEILGLRADILHDLAMNNHHADTGDEVTIAYLQQAIAVLEPTGLRNRKGINLMGIGNVKSRQKQYTEALTYHKLAASFFEESESINNFSCVMCNIGSCYMALGDLVQAEDYLLRALDLRTRVGNYTEIANNYYHLSRLQGLKGNPDKAYEYMKISRDYAMASQTIGLQLLILNELETMALARRDTIVADQCQASLTAIGQVHP